MCADAGPAPRAREGMLDHANNAGPSCFLGQCARGDRFAEVAALAVAVALIGLLASLETTGWVIPAWTAGEIGALEARGVGATTLWGVTFTVVAHVEARRGASVVSPIETGAEVHQRRR